MRESHPPHTLSCWIRRSSIIIRFAENERVEGRIINVRRLVALDITLHGPPFIAIEFGLGTPGIIAVGIFVAVRGPFLLGLYLLLTGINYLPILIYTIIILRAGTATSEVEGEMSADVHYVRKYSTQQFLIFIPFAIVALALTQLNKSEGGMRQNRSAAVALISLDKLLLRAK